MSRSRIAIEAQVLLEDHAKSCEWSWFGCYREHVVPLLDEAGLLRPEMTEERGVRLDGLTVRRYMTDWEEVDDDE